MTAKTETNFWKTLKTYLNDGEYVVSRLESYVTPGFPDCLIFHKDTGFFTLELKVVNSSNRVALSPFQIAWNMKHAMVGAPSYILVSLPVSGEVKLFHGCKAKDLGQSTVDLVTGLYHGRLADLDLVSIVKTPKLPNSSG